LSIDPRETARGVRELKMQNTPLILTIALVACGGSEPSGDPSTGGADVGGAAAGGEASGGVGAAGGVEIPGDPVCSRFASEVVSTSFGDGQPFGQAQLPDIVLGPPLGGGCCTGSLDVASLGNGGEIVLAFGSGRIVDGPGPDFVVFENPFEAGSGVFAELGTVSLSEDGDTWHTFPCDATDAPYGSCAGFTPVLLDGVDAAFDPADSGGDAFDLADLGIGEARFVRIVDRGDITGLNGVFDLDAVGIVNLECR
jgi:hypothetical protein